ncbi:methyl-accepting chemotaxis protein [Marinobacter salinisoli]|uniref:methyl-accepting chemotaxis protein n=1 Tax=Marinobacter salinisoli TaxID=2769486 RepID=UPI001D18098A|nr:methyl-accepting chemotaxis protein [Marinobacter salinisoli]
MSESLTLAQQERLRADRYLVFILLAHVPVVSLLIPLEFDTGAFAALASMAVAAIAGIGYASLRGTRTCSVLFAGLLMAFSAIMIQAQMGRIEMHFHIFAALALTIIYRDWLPIITAAGVIAAHHLLFTSLQKAGVTLGDMPILLFAHGATFGMAFLHAAFVVFESGILVFFALRMAAERRQAFQIIDVVRGFGDSKDLGGRLDARGDARTANYFNSMMDQFGDLIGKVRMLSGTLSHSANKLSRVSEHTSSIIEQQHLETDQAASATEEMTATVQEVARNAQQASEAASRAQASAAEGRRHADHAVELTESTHAVLNDASVMVNELTEKVRAIGGVIAAINDISDQTNLLALNAAIEAARAGAHGRGFAVVAEEVRSLSARTQDFTRQIRTTIDELMSLSDTASGAIGVSQARSGATTEAARQTGDAIRLVVTAIAEVSDMNHQIAAAAEQQAAASSQINNGVQSIAGRNLDVVREAEQTRSMARELERVIAEVDDLVRDYRGA